MKLTVLGRSGTCPAPGGACSGYLLQHEGTRVLIDCGSGVLARLQLFTAIEQIDAIILSHLHYDHISDLFSLKYAIETLRAAGVPVGRLPLALPATPASLAAEIASGDLFAVTQISDGVQTRFGPFSVRFDWMPHLIDSYAVTITCEQKKLVYSGDTGMNNRLSVVAHNADILLCESTFAADGDPLACDHHLSAENAGRIAAEGGVRRLLLTHLWCRENEERYLEHAARYFPGAEIATELSEYSI